MKAKKKPLETITPAALGVTPAQRLTVLQVEAPPARKKGVLVKSVDELVAALSDRGLV
jgi:electron transfer flavoprotein beta subunit